MKFATTQEIQSALSLVSKGIYANEDYLLILLHEDMLKQASDFEEVDLDEKSSLFLSPETAMEISKAKNKKNAREGHPILGVGSNVRLTTIGDLAFVDHQFTDMIVTAYPLENGWLVVPVHKGMVLFTVAFEVTEYLNNEDNSRIQD